MLIVALMLLGAGRAPELPTLGSVPGFLLIDQYGRTTSLDELRGHVWVADFIFTRCSGQCPLMSAKMAELSKTLADERALRFVSFTVDPQHDTPEVLAKYAVHYGAETPRWVFLTGRPDDIRELCQQGFKLGLGENPDDAREPVIHSVRLVLVDGQGAIRGYYDATDPQKLHQLIADTRRLLREQ